MGGGLDAVLARRDTGSVPGVAVGVLVDGRRELRCDGVTSVQHPLPVDEHTLFQLGSVSKVVTATAVLALVDRDVVGLEDLVADHLRTVDFGAATSTLTVEHLLSHRGGWEGDWSLFNAPASHDDDALQRMVQAAADVPRYSDPGGPFSYDNFGTCVAGALIEELTGECFDVAVRKLVLDPLGLAESVYWPDEAIWGLVALGHSASGGLARGTEPWADAWPARRALWPQGGLVSSVADALEFSAVHATGAPTRPDAQLPLSQAGLDEMQRPRASSGGQGTSVALGWHTRTASDAVLLSHTGAGQGFFARVVVVPACESALVVLTNSANGPSLVDDIYTWYIHETLGLSEDQLTPEPAPDDAEQMIGEYRAVSRTIHLDDLSTSAVTARVGDAGPTWGGSTSHDLKFRSGQRLESSSGTRMEYGILDDGRRWLRYRGRVHVQQDTQQAPRVAPT